MGSGRIGNCVFTLCTWLGHFYNDCVVLTDELCFFRQVPVLWNAILLHEVGCENLKNVTGHILNIWKMRIHFWFVGQPQLVEPVQFTYFEILRFISTTLYFVVAMNCVVITVLIILHFVLFMPSMYVVMYLAVGFYMFY